MNRNLEGLKVTAFSTQTVKPCLKIERWIQDALPDSSPVDILIQIQEHGTSEAERAQMLWHFNLLHYVKIGLSRQEFQEKFHPLNVELSTKYHLWEHNKGCAIFFVTIYEGFI